MQSPPKHRHDGTSPLPLGMDWSPPPRIWSGRDTVWPHDPRTGWSYCITIPSWIVLAKSRESDPTVFYRVQVGIQSPEGITTARIVLRRFNDFLKLHAALKRAFPRKSIPPTPPKGLLQMKTRAMLETRRSSLEEWMAKLLSDIEVSRSIVVASFLELEAAARASFQEEGQHNSDSHVSVDTTDPSLHVHPNSSLLAGSSSLTSDYGSDTAYETSEIGTPSLGRDNNSEIGMDDLPYFDDVTSPIDKFVKYGVSNIDEGLSMGQAIIEKLENFPKHKMHAREIHHKSEHDTTNGNSSKASHHAVDMLEHLSEPNHSTVVRHVRKLSNESIGSDKSSQRGGLSNLAFPSSNGHGFLDFRSGAEVSRTTAAVGDSDYQLPDDMHLLVPMDQRQKMNRVLTTLQRRLITAKTDMEDLISRLTQETAVKDYLATKVKDLEVELETTKQKSKENLEQAILIERERVTQMEWDMEELRRKSMEMELKLNSQQAQSLVTQSTNSPDRYQKDMHQELDLAKQQFEDLLKRHQELEVKSKADIKVLVKEVRSLRSSQAELNQKLNQSLKEKSKIEELLQGERERNEQTSTSWRKLLHRCKILHEQLHEFNVNKSMGTEGDVAVSNTPSLLDPSDVSETSGHQIGLLIAEAQHLAQDIDYSASTTDRDGELDDNLSSVEDELRQILTTILVDNGELRKQVKSLILHAPKMDRSNDNVDFESH